MPVKDSNTTTINHVFHDDMVDAHKLRENDIKHDPRFDNFGPDLPVKIFINKGSISLEFPSLSRKVVENEGDENYISLSDRISITIDYFGDKLRIYHNTAEMLKDGIPYDEQAEILIIPSIKNFVEENGKQ